MAQHDDFSNPPSRPSSPGESGLPARPGGLSGSDQGSPFPAEGDWRNRPSATARRRNQWRQYQHLAPDFGDSSPDPTRPADPTPAPSLAPPPAKAALPSFNRSSRPPQGASPARLPQEPMRPLGVQSPASPPPRSPAARSMPSLHPHSSSLGQNNLGQNNLGQGNPGQRGGGAAVAPRPPIPAMDPATKVTPLRARDSRRRTVGMATGVAAVAAATTAGIAALAAPPRRENSPTRSRRFSPQRRLAKLPQPALYLVRLAILGIGVAAIAGTLLSVFSPSNVASHSGGAATAPAARRGNASAIPGQGAITIAAIQPTSELTRLKAQLDQLATLTPGLTPGVYAFDLDSGRYVDLSGTQTVAAASTIKVPILAAFLQQVDAGNLALNQALVLQERHLAGGAGTMANDAIGSEYTALEAATRMIIHSDNTATNLLIEALGGAEALNQQFTTWGLESTVLRNPLPDLEGTNTTSTRDLALLMALLDQGDLLSRRSRERLFSTMQRTVNRSLIAFSLTDGSLVANKTGDLAMTLGDVALVDTPQGNRYALAVMVQRPNNDGRASELIRRITETVHRELNQPIAPVGRTAESEVTPSLEGNPAEAEEVAPTDPAAAPGGDPNPAPGGGGRSPAAPSGDQVPPG